MSMEYRNFTLYSEADLANILARLQYVLSDWSKQWLVNAEISIDQSKAYSDFCLENTDVVLQTHVYNPKGDHWCAIHFLSDDFHRLSLAICHVTAKHFEVDKSQIADAVCEQALKELSVKLADATEASDVVTTLPIVPDYASNMGSGCLSIEVKLNECNFYLTVSEEFCLNGIDANHTVSNYAEDLVEVKEALKKTPVYIDITLGNAEIDIKELAQLNVGDVIEIDKSLTELCDVHVCGVESNIGCYLGNVDGITAAKLVSK